MDELARLKLRRRRRQEMFQTLNRLDDTLRLLRDSFAEIDALQAHPWRSILRPWCWHQVLEAISRHARRASLLTEIGSGVEAIRAEFHSLRVSDERELQALEALQQSIKTPTPTR